MQILHNLDRPLRILDAGGGNGVNTAWLLRRGHDVTLLDSDPEMLDQARQHLEHAGLVGQCHLVPGAIENAGEILSDQRFDLIVCHHVLEYLQDPVQAITAFSELGAKGSELSLVTLNPISEVIRAVVFRKDGALASSRLADLAYDAKWFGQARLYPFDQVVDWGSGAGWSLKDFRAIRVLADYIPEDEYTDSRIEEMMELEERLAGREPYRRIGRYLQFSFDKDSAHASR